MTVLETATLARAKVGGQPSGHIASARSIPGAQFSGARACRLITNGVAQEYPYQRPDASFIYIDGHAYVVAAGELGAPSTLQVVHPVGRNTVA